MPLGIISDTHGLLRPEAIAALRDAERILHAGDIGKPEILDTLTAIAPVSAVRGNNDSGDWARDVPETESLEYCGKHIYMLHDLKTLDIDPAANGIDVVIAGHSHKPHIEHREGVLYVNPGSAGPRRFSLPVTIAEISVTNDEVQARIVELGVPAGKRR